MPKAKPGREFCLDVVDKVDVGANIVFTDSLRGIHSVYTAKLQELIGQPGKSLKIFASDTSTMQQIKKAAEKLKVKLLFGRADKYIYISVFQLTEGQHRLLEAINTHNAPSVNILQGDSRLKEVNILDSLRTLSAMSCIRLEGNIWKATPTGQNELVLHRAASA